jgi:putative endonuclease
MNNTKPKDPRKQTGADGEKMAKIFLESKGYTCLHQNWSLGRGDIDLIMEHGKTLVFVEVKTRLATVPIEDMGPSKRQVDHLYELAERYLEKYPPIAEVRFDLVFVNSRFSGAEVLHIEHGLSG